MHDLHDYYKVQALETEQTGFEVIIRKPHVFIILMKRSTLSVGSACFSYTRDALSIYKY
jgi:hypothetical protein